MVGPSSQEFGTKLAKRMGLPLLAVTTTEFPDGEIKYKFDEKLDGLEVLLVQSTYPPADRHYMQLFLASHHMSQEGARVHAVIPYLGYARQGKAFLPGEIVSLGIIAHLLRSVGVQRVSTVDMHSAEGLALFSMPVYSVSAIPGLAQYVKTHVKLDDPIVVAPDAGSLKRTQAFAALYGAKSIQFKKSRDRVTGRIKMEAPAKLTREGEGLRHSRRRHLDWGDGRGLDRAPQEGGREEGRQRLRPRRPAWGDLRQAHQGGSR